MPGLQGETPPRWSTSRGTIQRDRLRTSTEHPADLGPASAMGNEQEGLPSGTIIKDTDKDDDSVALPESLPCAGHSLSLTQLLAQRGLGGHRVLIPSLWVLLWAAPSPGLLGLRSTVGSSSTRHGGGAGDGGGGGLGCCRPEGRERGERTHSAFPPLSSPSPILDPGDPQLLGRWEAGGRGSPAQG